MSKDDIFQFTMYGADGRPLQVLKNIIDVTWIRTVNRVGSCTLVLNPKSRYFDYGIFTQPDLGLLIESGSPLVPDLDTFWFLREFTESITNQQETLSLTFEDSNSLLARRIVSLRADSPEGTEPRTRLNGPGNSIMRDLVQDIFSIPSNGRDWSQFIRYAPIAESTPLVRKEVNWRNILQTLQQIARTSLDKGTPLFFDMVARTNNIFEFTTYINQRGTFHDGIVVETTNPSFKLNSFNVDYNIPNTAYVGGAGKGANRKVGFAQDTDEITGVFGLFETFKSLNVSDDDVLNDEASELINGAAGKISLNGQLLGDLRTVYGFGDRLIIKHRNYEVESTIATVRTTIRNQRVERDIIVKSL